jgi:small-conductance mechanosensitive channel
VCSSDLWHFQLFTVSDNIIVDGRAITTERSITIGKSIGAILILVLGFVLVRRMVTSVMKIAMRRSKLTQSTALIVTRWITLFAGLTLIIFSFILVDIPLSIFAFAGGALAIGIGFGSQNIVSNFISGLILMAEKPIKVGDIVQVSDTIGTVIEIGVRATRIRTMENKIWILPNSIFLENAVLNWTDNNPVIRTEVVVGVAYGSNTEHVQKLAIDLMNSVDFTEKEPAPRVIFSNFGDNSLEFKLVFWADNTKIDSYEKCRSDLRFAIDRVFRENNIEISFPQRDLHLRSAVPIEIVTRS